MLWIRKVRRGMMVGLVCSVLAGCNTVKRAETDCANQQVSWVDVLKINDVLYSSSYGTPDPQLEDRQGGQVGEVTYRMDGHACGDHTMRNGDAAFLQPGTEVYEMKGYRPEFRVIAHGKLYQVDRNPDADTLGELWDIEGKVKRVSLSQGKDEPVGDFTEEAAAAFIKGLLELRFVGYEAIRAIRGDEAGFLLRMELEDGTSVHVSYYPEANVLSPGAHGTVGLKELATSERMRIKDIVEGRAGSG